MVGATGVIAAGATHREFITRLRRSVVAGSYAIFDQGVWKTQMNMKAIR